MNSTALLVELIGEFGWWQFWLVVLLFLSKFPTGWHLIMVVIISPKAGNFTCKNQTLDKCDPNCPRHEFDHTIWEQTIVYEWDLVCDREYLVSVVQGSVMAGIFVGSVVFGYLSDRYGRRRPMIGAVSLALVSGVAASFVPWFWAYVFLRFLQTVGTGATMPISFVILMEFIGVKYRILLGILYHFPFHFAHASLGLLGYLVRRWDYIQLILSVPNVVLLSYWCLLPESPRWLLTMGKTDECVMLLEKICMFNKQPHEKVREKVEEFIKEHHASSQKHGGDARELFISTRMRLKTLSLFLNWFSIAMSFYAIAQYLGQLGGNIFINIAAAGLIQAPGNIIAYFLLPVIGRKYSLLVSYSLCFVPLFIIPTLPYYPYWPTQAMGCIAMMGIAMCFSVIYIYSTELFPTVIRTIGMGLVSMIARVGSILSPFIMHLDVVGYWLPPIALAIFPVISAIVTLFVLPETINTILPDTIEDADEI